MMTRSIRRMRRSSTVLAVGLMATLGELFRALRRARSGRSAR